VLCGTYAIAEFLGEEHPTAPVLGSDRGARAEVRRLIDWFHAKCQREATLPLLDAKVTDRLRGEAGTAPDPGALRGVRINLRYHMRYIEHLSERRNWLAGDAMSFADFAAAAHVSVADYLNEIAWDDFAAARVWYARMKSRPAVRAILAERVPGAQAPPAHYADPDF
jgi:glutathione S-transferase